MSTKMRLLLMLFLGAVCFAPPVWMLFNTDSAGAFGSNLALVSIFLVLCVGPVYPLCLQLRRRPQSAIPILLLIGTLVCAFAYGVAQFVLHLDTPFAGRVADLGTLLMMTSCLLFIWQAFFRKRPSDSPTSSKRDG